MTAPCRPKKMLPSYMRWIRRSISNGLSPTTQAARPRQILCDSGASIIALATCDDESTSPTPTKPASVWTLTTSVSWLPSQRSLTSGRRRWMASTRVIFMGGVRSFRGKIDAGIAGSHPRGQGGVLESDFLPHQLDQGRRPNPDEFGPDCLPGAPEFLKLAFHLDLRRVGTSRLASFEGQESRWAGIGIVDRES